MKLRLVTLEDYGLGRKYAAIWEGDLHIGNIEYRGHSGKITEVYALGVEPAQRRKGYGRRIVKEIIANPKAKISNIEKSAQGFWQKVTN